jgi:hypothetical protein
MGRPNGRLAVPAPNHASIGPNQSRSWSPSELGHRAKLSQLRQMEFQFFSIYRNDLNAGTSKIHEKIILGLKFIKLVLLFI